MTLELGGATPELAATRPSTGPAVVSRTFVLLLTSILLLNIALQINVGFYAPQALAFYAAAFVTCVYVGVQGSIGPLANWAIGRGPPLAAGVLVVQLGLLLAYPPLMYLRPMSSDAFMVFPLIMTLVTMLCVNTAAARPVLGRAQGVVIFAGWAFLGVWTLLHTPNPAIDTYPMAQEASRALLHGENPYAITFPDIYYGTGQPYVYPPGFAANGRVLVGYSYPPLTLLMSLPGYLITGDHRYSLLAAFLVIAIILYRLGGATYGVVAAGLFLTAPRVFAIFESAWTEPFVLVLLAATVWCAVRWRAALPWAFGLFLCSKQHMILFAPAALWLMPRPLSVRHVATFYGKAFGIGIVVTLPFVLWAIRPFFHSVIELQLIYQSRLDALSFPPFFHYQGWPMPPRFTSLLLVPVAYGLAWWRVPRTVWGFALTLAFVAFCTLAFDQAFLNRNFFVMTAMIFALATLPRPPTDAVANLTPVEQVPAAG